LPVPIVAGLSRVEEVIGEFCWTPLGGLLEGEEPGEAAGEVETVARWLQGSCFHAAERRRVDAHAAAPSLVWRQDPLRLETRRRDRLQGDLERLEAEKQALAEERRRLAEERHSLAEALAAAVAAREASLAEAGALAAEVEALQGQVTSLVAEVRAAALAARQEPRRGDLRLCTDPADPRCGTLLMLLSAPGEPERWESAVSRS
jgi:hypothetical protein